MQFPPSNADTRGARHVYKGRRLVIISAALHQHSQQPPVQPPTNRTKSTFNSTTTPKMKFQLLAASAALLVASASAVPTPQASNNVLIPDTDGSAFDAEAVAAVQARGLLHGTDDGPGGDADADTADVLATRRLAVPDLEGSAAFDAAVLATRDVGTDAEDATASAGAFDAAVVEARDVDAETDGLSDHIEGLETRHVNTAADESAGAFDAEVVATRDVNAGGEEAVDDGEE